MLLYKTERALGGEQYVQRSEVEGVSGVRFPNQEKQHHSENRYAKQSGKVCFALASCMQSGVCDHRHQKHLISKAVGEKHKAVFSAV